MEGAETGLAELGKDWISIDSVPAAVLDELGRLVGESEKHLEWEGKGIRVSCPTNIMRKKMEEHAPGTQGNPHVVHDHPGPSAAIAAAVENLITQ
jgi:hypothetical protein